MRVSRRGSLGNRGNMTGQRTAASDSGKSNIGGEKGGFWAPGGGEGGGLEGLIVSIKEGLELGKKDGRVPRRDSLGTRGTLTGLRLAEVASVKHDSVSLSGMVSSSD